MTAKLQEMFKEKNKKTMTNLLAVLAVGLMLLIFSGSIFGVAEDNAPPSIPATEDIAPVMAPGIMQSDNEISHEADLERRLEEILSLVEGAGEVRVMLTIRQERELIIASDTIHNTFITRESDSDGGIREISDIKIEERNILIQDNNNSASRPLILTENAPRVEGIIIIAQGGDNIIVRDALTRASQAVLGIDINRIQVLKMK